MRWFSITCAGAWQTHPAALVEALAARAARDLLELAHREQPHLLAVVLRERREQHRADRHVDADAERVGAAHHAQQALLRELLDEQPVLRQQARVVQADAVAQQALHVLAVGRVEAEAGERLADRLALLARRDVRRGQRLRLLRRLALREVHDVDGRPPLLHQRLDRLVQRRLAVLEVERHRPLAPSARARPRDSVTRSSRSSIGARVAERRRHQQELRAAAASAAAPATRRRDRRRRSSGTRPSRRRARRPLRRCAAPCSSAPRRCSR